VIKRGELRTDGISKTGPQLMSTDEIDPKALARVSQPIRPPNIKNLPGVLRELGIDPTLQNTSVPETRSQLALTEEVFEPGEAAKVKHMASAVDVTMSKDFLKEKVGIPFFASSEEIPEELVEALQKASKTNTRYTPVPFVCFQIQPVGYLGLPRKTWTPVPKDHWDKLDHFERGMIHHGTLPGIKNRKPVRVDVVPSPDGYVVINSYGSSIRKVRVAYWKAAGSDDQ
jgi:hypothetical protein